MSGQNKIPSEKKDEAKVRALAGQSDREIARALGISKTTVLNARREQEQEIGVEQARGVAELSTRFWKAGITPEAFSATLATAKQLLELGLAGHQPMHKAIADELVTQGKGPQEARTIISQLAREIDRSRVQGKVVDLAELPGQIHEMVDQKVALEKNLPALRQACADETARLKTVKGEYERIQSEIQEYRDTKRLLDQYQVCRDPARVNKFLANLAESDGDAKKVIDKICTSSSLDKEIIDKAGRRDALALETERLQKTVKLCHDELTAFKAELATASEERNALHEAKEIGLTVPILRSLTQKIKEKSHAKSIPSAKAVEEFIDTDMQDYEALVGFKEAIKRDKDAHESAKKLLGQLQQECKVYGDASQVVVDLLRLGRTPEQIMRMSYLKTFADRETFERFLTEAGTYGSVSEAVNALSAKKQRLEQEVPMLEKSVQSLQRQNDHEQERNIDLAEKNRQQALENNKLLEIWRRHQLPEGLYDLAVGLQGEDPLTAKPLLALHWLLLRMWEKKVLTGQGIFGQIEEYYFTEVLGALRAKIARLDKEKDERK